MDWDFYIGITPFSFKLNNLTGLDIEIMRIEVQNFDGSLFALWIKKRRFIVEIIYLRFEISLPWM